jgi:ATP-dependent helicase/nuclease subunit A
LSRQLLLLDAASVSTLHGFCSRLLRQHFHLVGLDPAFGVMDGDEAKLLRVDVARQLIEDRYELDDAGEFQRFIDAYGDGDDERVLRRVIHANEMLNSLVDRDGWIERSLRRIEEGAAAGKLEASDLGRELSEFLSSGLAAIRGRCDEAIEQVGRIGGFAKYVAVLREHAAALTDWERSLREGGVDAPAAEVARFVPPKLPPVKNDVPGKDLAKAAVDGVRGAMKAGPWFECLRFTSGEWREGLARVAPHAKVFLGLVKQFDERYRMARTRRGRSISPTWSATRCGRCATRASPGRSRHRPLPARITVGSGTSWWTSTRTSTRCRTRSCACSAGSACAREPGAETNLFCVGGRQAEYLPLPPRRTDAVPRPPARVPLRAAGRGEVIDLQANFRSRPPLLEAVNGVFERLMTEAAVDLTYDHSHRLQPGKKFPEAANGEFCFTGAPIELHLLPDKIVPGDVDDAGNDVAGTDCDADDLELDRAERGAVLVARRIRELVGLDGGSPTCVMEAGPGGVIVPRPMRFGDVVILLRSMKHKADEYAEVLEAAGVPVHSDSGSGYFDATEVRDLMALLSVLDTSARTCPWPRCSAALLREFRTPKAAWRRVRLAYRRTRSLPRRRCAFADEGATAWPNGLRNSSAGWRGCATLDGGAPARPAPRIFEETGYLAYCGGLRNAGSASPTCSTFTSAPPSSPGSTARGCRASWGSREPAEGGRPSASRRWRAGRARRTWCGS